MPGDYNIPPPHHPTHESPPIALPEVIRFLVESEPLRNVTEVSRCLETVVSKRESHSRIMASISVTLRRPDSHGSS